MNKILLASHGPLANGMKKTAETHCVSLSEKTIQANQRFFESKEQVPKQAYTMGIGTIRSARKILINY